ncbi:MAG: 3-hydroxyacyl-CoA dehydrogenase/enoyl-CoA hydratase family protein [Betaproteobacteria bacterium]|nr:3-hydroxyacyl-CoA dehydrogenase/enoyl-CoA hydratase family protein [Betaproteobacteria bacterium]MDE1956941.1 3-hydroxyacyl-CoA dehydrogenase/enoyl-CoA hydratase family protein [Betaproteobacteria bacterium]MDE2150840.1 3-hydroxyacyl-CoA dehydrogenase/enoyl-CoA hydratase family protein [Betaproteobacteria bacterium]
MSQNFPVRQVAVLGAGVMGAQIAAHCVNARVPVILFDLPAKEGPKNGIAERAVANLKKLSPAPLGLAQEAELIRCANYDDDLALLAGCDLVIEAIAERMDWKHDLYRKVTSHLAPSALFATNTSGLSITRLGEGFDEALRQRFCGVHFFNPPRYMPLVELIPTAHTRPEVLDRLESFLTTTLGKSVVRALDTPNFVANRVGVFSILAVMHEAERFGLSFDVVDDLTGSKLGRAKSATFRTADVVGLDTMAHVIGTMRDTLPLDKDPFAALYATPKVLAQLVERGALGQKSGAGFYKKAGKDILRLDPAAGEYVPGGGKAEEIVARMLKKPAAERFELLRNSSNPQAQFLWSIFRDVWHYIALHLGDIADNARDLDFAIRWGFGWNEGPFETWQAAGWKRIAGWIAEDIAAGKALCAAPLPDWVQRIDAVHTPEGSWSAAQGCYKPRRELPVMRRQLFGQSVLGESAPDARTGGATVFEDESIRLWTAPGADDVLVASFKTKMNTLGPGVVAGLNRAVELAEASYRGLVVWQTGEPFSAGADLQAMLPAFMSGGAKAIEPEEKKLQDLVLRLRYAQVPVIAAVRGMALGGGCELAVHAARRVVALESYIGLVEVGVGLIPGGGGLCFLARRAAELAQAAGADADPMVFLKGLYMQPATAAVSKSAIEARRMGWLRDDDLVVLHKDELLFVAVEQARSMAASGWRPPVPALIPVAGRSAIATIRGQLANMRDGGQISAHDELLGRMIAEVVCGGDVDPGTRVDEAWLMRLERERFCRLLEHPKTQERIMSLLQAGKPVRN